MMSHVERADGNTAAEGDSRMTTRACATCRENVRLIDTLTNAAWDAVTAAPGMRRLYPGY